MSTLLLAGGGTGGHIYPLIAVADALREISPKVRLVFAGTEKGYEKDIVPRRGYELVMTQARPLRGRGPVGAALGSLHAMRALAESYRLLSRYQPSGILTVGGYAAGPIALMAYLRGIPVALLEPNAVMGLANRLIAPLATRGYTVFAAAEGHFRPGRARRLGLPIRRGFDRAPYEPSNRPLRVLVIGGSQGAQALNEAMPQVVRRLSVPVAVRHQSGLGNQEAVRQSYADCGGSSVEVLAYIESMERELVDADLVISRSGAGAISEICSVGRPSLLVPYPFAAGDHQRKNALILESLGAALCIPQSEPLVEHLTTHIARLSRSPGERVAMAQRAAEFGRPDAAFAVAKELLVVSGLAAESCASFSTSASPNRISEVE